MNDPRMRVVVVGHVDHGKSSLVGRMIYDSGSAPQSKIEEIQNYCRNNSKPFEFAFLLDALKDERSQGITIEVSRVFLKGKKRDFLILDAPGHEQFLKNMVTGAAHAHAAILVVDANEGVQGNSKRHATMLSMLGIKKVILAVNKMDLVNYQEDRFVKIAFEMKEFLAKHEMTVSHAIPVCAMTGENLVTPASNMNWYTGAPLLSVMESLEHKEADLETMLRASVQDIYKFSKFGDNRRIISGQVLAGRMEVGQKIKFLPSGYESTIKCIEGSEESFVQRGVPYGITINDEIYIKRGEMIVATEDFSGTIAQRFVGNLFWLDKDSLKVGERIRFKINNQSALVRVRAIPRTLQSSTLDEVCRPSEIRFLDVAEVEFESSTPIFFDPSGSDLITNRFVLVRDFVICGGGKILKALKSEEVSKTRPWVRVQEEKSSSILVLLYNELASEEIDRLSQHGWVSDFRTLNEKSQEFELALEIFSKSGKPVFALIGEHQRTHILDLASARSSQEVYEAANTKALWDLIGRAAIGRDAHSTQ